jgi:nucleoside 2-deoxyribosyltransferase
MKVYLASPWFKNNEKVMYTQMISKMRAEGIDVYAPVEHEVPNAWDLSNADWGRAVFQADIQAIQECDEVWVLNFGMYSDSGTAWEMGYALSLGTPVTQVLCGGENAVYSLMTINSAHNVCDLGNFSVEHTTVDISKIIQK